MEYVKMNDDDTLWIMLDTYFRLLLLHISYITTTFINVVIGSFFKAFLSLVCTKTANNIITTDREADCRLTGGEKTSPAEIPIDDV